MPSVPRLIELPENTRGRDFVVADLHGHVERLESELAARHFDPATDRVLAVGDLIDRGPQSPRALELLDAPWFFSVRGNHEQAMLDWVNAMVEGRAADEIRSLAARHFSWGGDWALPLFTSALRDGTAGLLPWQRALAALPIALSTRAHATSIGVVHATVPGGDWGFFRATAADPHGLHLALWSRRPEDDIGSGVQGIDIVFAGHTQVPAVRSIHNFRMIETAVWAGNALTLIELNTQTLQRPVSRARQLWRGLT